MQNPFTTTFSKAPKYTYISTEKTNQILDNFSYDDPTESVYKITGVRGSGKTVILSKIEESLRESKSWLVFDINPSRNMLIQMAAMMQKEGFKQKKNSINSLNVSASVMGTGGGIGYSSSNTDDYSDIGVEIELMFQEVIKQNKKILIGIDEVSKSKEMISFTLEFGKWLRANYPVYLVCTGLYENMIEMSNVQNLTFFRRATTILTEPLNKIRIAEMYKDKLNVNNDEAKAMASLTKGYAYAFQELGTLYFNKENDETLKDIERKLKSELFAYSYEKIWEELSVGDQQLLSILIDKDEYKREEVLIKMKDSSNNYSVYRDRLIKRGLLNTRHGYISLSLPYFKDFIVEYCL